MRIPLHESTLKELMPKGIDYIDKMMVNRFQAIPIDKDDEKIVNVMDDPFIPPYETICGVYCIYRRSILDVLRGRIMSFESYEFKTAFTADKLIEEQHVEDVLDFATFVVIASADKDVMSHYFIGGDCEKLNSILNVCSGYPKGTNEKTFSHAIQRFKKDITTVENMGYLENIVHEKA